MWKRNSCGSNYLTACSNVGHTSSRAAHTGMIDALPADVQAILRRKGPPRGPSPVPIDLAIEARDPRVASDVVLQFLAFRHHDHLNAPANLKSLYLTFQFYHFPPTTSDMAYLVPVRLEDDAVDSTCVLVRAGQGLRRTGWQPFPGGCTGWVHAQVHTR